MSRSPQVSATIPEDLLASIQELADKDSRTISQMVAILLQYAVKEKNRKRRGNKENNTENYSPDMGACDRQ